MLRKVDPTKHLFLWKKHNLDLKVASDDNSYLDFGEIVYDEICPVPNFRRNFLNRFSVDLSPALEGGVGHVIVIATPTTKSHYPNHWSSRNVVSTWIQCTHIGIDTIPEKDQIFGKLIPRGGFNFQLGEQIFALGNI